jgi:DNA-binding protein HU-beta
MYKTELIALMATQAGITKAQAKLALQAYVDAVQTTLQKGGAVSILGFGSFKVQRRAQRKNYNIRTKQLEILPATKIPKFKAGKVLKNALNY